MHLYSLLLLWPCRQATLDMLSKGTTGGAGAGGAGRKVSELVAYKNVTDMQHNSSLTVQVGAGTWGDGCRGRAEAA